MKFISLSFLERKLYDMDIFPIILMVAMATHEIKISVAKEIK